MKKLIPIFIILLALSACDSPRSQRSTYSNSSNGLGNGYGYDYNSPTDTRINSGSSSSSSTDATTTADTNIPEDAKHCKFSKDGVTGFESISAHIGSYTLCQGKDKNSFYFQIKTPPVGSTGDVSICFIPHTTSGTNSIYVGNPMCGIFSDPKAIKQITFVKYSQYTNALINSVMFFKDTSYFYPVPYNRYMMTLDAYKLCMARLSAPYFNTQFCQIFKSVNQYVLRNY
jgi:hypothetical protein